MKIRQRKPAVMFLILITVIVLIVSGCRRPDDPELFDSVETPDEIVTPDETPTEIEDDPESETVQSEGRYIGFADSRSVEIELDDAEQDFMVFQLEDSVLAQLEAEEPETGAPVRITFIVSELGQPMITELEPL